ncbi:translocation/assembly module TamB domain-containing protein [Megasphaera sueciensis]|uniref:translocation/assembly module TamB domain-containing protein n=1 Tax=Megasphaera sueciensis TaxID=349094 RepID=UPI003D03BC15
MERELYESSSLFLISDGGRRMKRKWIALAVIASFLAVLFSLWREKPVLIQYVSTTITTTLNEHINGTFSFSAMDVSLTGKIFLYDPLIKDTQGRTVITGNNVEIQVNPWQMAKLAAAGDNVVPSVQTVTVVAPVVHIWENTPGQWNIASLIKKNANMGDSGFRAVIYAKNGTIKAATSDGMSVQADSCEGMVDFSSYPDIYGQIAMHVDGESIIASGHYTSTHKYDIKLRGDAVKAAYVVPFMPETADVKVEQGIIKNISAHIVQNHRGMMISGNADIQNGMVNVHGYEIDSLTGHVGLTTNEVTLRNISGNVNGQAVHLDGVVKTNAETPVFQLDVRAPSVDIAAVIPNMSMPVSGSVGIHARLWGTVDALHASGTIALQSIDAQGIVMQHGHVDFSYENEIFFINQASADVAEGAVQGSGSYSWKNGDYNAKIQFKNICLTDIPQVPTSIMGTFSGAIEAAGNINSGSLYGQGHVDADDLSYNGWEAQQAQLDFSYNDGLLHILNAKAEVQGGTIQADGTYDWDKGISDIRFHAVNMPLSLFSAYVSTPLTGNVSAIGRIYGTEPSWSVNFHAVTGSIKNVPFDNVNGVLTGKGQHIDIPFIQWQYKDEYQKAMGMIDLGTREIEISLDTQHMRLEKLLSLAEVNMPLTGWVQNHVEVKGTLDDPSAVGEFQLTEGSAYGYLYKSVSANYKLSKGIVTLSNGDLAAYDSHIRFYGTAGDRLAIHVESPDLDVSRIMPHIQTQKSGIVNISAYIGGTFDNPTATGVVRSQRLVVNNIPVTDLKSDFGYYDGIIRLQDLQFKQNGGFYQANASYKPSTDWIKARASVMSGDIESWLKLLNLPVKDVSGKIDGNISIDGTVHDPQGKIKGKITQAGMAGFPVQPTDIDIQLDKGVVEVNKLAIAVDNGVLAAQGTYALHGPVHLQVGSRNFSSKILTDILGKNNIDVDTRIDCAADVSGASDHPQVDMSVQFNGGTINGISFTNIFGLINVRDGIIHINQAFISRDPYKASAYGTIPVGALMGNQNSDESMNVTFKLENAGLDILAFVTPLVTQGNGGLNGSVKLTGTLAEPHLTGNLSVHHGTLQFRYLKNPLENIEAAIVLDGTKATITSSGTMDGKGKKNKGYYSLNGEVRWNGWKIQSYQGSLELNKLGIDCDYFKGPLSGQLSIEEGHDFPLLKGNIEISDATLNIPLIAINTGNNPDLEMDMTVSFGKNVRLYNPVLYDLIVMGAATFHGTVSHPIPSGQFEALRGSVRYLDTKFNITKGQADFSQADSFIPYMMVEGNGRVGQYNVMLTLRGPADNMNMLLRSQPPLTRQQIVSLITLRNGGRNSSSLKSDDVSGLIGTGVRMTLDSLGVTSTLERAFSLDVLNVTSGSLNMNERLSNENKNYYNIEMGKYLFNDFMLTAAFGLNHRDNRAGLRYDVSNHMSINAWRASDDSYIGGQYRYSFY